MKFGEGASVLEAVDCMSGYNFARC